MKDSQTVGVATILIGILLVVGAVRGTWKKLFADVVLGTSMGTSSGSSGETQAQAIATSQAEIAAVPANLQVVPGSIGPANQSSPYVPQIDYSNSPPVPPGLIVVGGH